MTPEVEGLLSYILKMSNIDHCEDYKDLIRAMEKINESIKEKFPNIEESE